jgi:hypothetical protein
MEIRGPVQQSSLQPVAAAVGRLRPGHGSPTRAATELVVIPITSALPRPTQPARGSRIAHPGGLEAPQGAPPSLPPGRRFLLPPPTQPPPRRRVRRLGGGGRGPGGERLGVHGRQIRGRRRRPRRELAGATRHKRPAASGSPARRGWRRPPGRAGCTSGCSTFREEGKLTKTWLDMGQESNMAWARRAIKLEERSSKGRNRLRKSTFISEN